MCKEYDIKNYMAYGSLLGAIRHKGFIPWDDDIDVMILRSDVEKLIKVVPSDHFDIMNYSINKKYFSPLLKIYKKNTLLIQDYGQNEGMDLGIYIDVFVLDNVPSDEGLRRNFYKKAERLRFFWGLSCRKFSTRSKNIFRKIIGGVISIPFKVIGYYHFAKKYDLFSSSLENTGSFGIVVYGEGYDKEFVYTEVDLEEICVKFEGLIVNIPKSYNEILTKCYGDYMKLPPVEERKKHKFLAYKNK